MWLLAFWTRSKLIKGSQEGLFHMTITLCTVILNKCVFCFFTFYVFGSDKDRFCPANKVMCSNKPNPKARKHCEMQCNQNPWYKTIKCVKNDLTIFTTLKILCPVGESDRLPFSPPWESDYWGKVIYCFHHPENLWPLGEGNRSTIFTTLRICDHWGKVIDLPFSPPWESVTTGGR